MFVHETPFVVVDLETTGLSAEADRIIEVAAVKVQGGAVRDEFVQLVNPERSVPRRITRMTGITTAMLFDKPTSAEVVPRLKRFVGDGVFVAHNVPFDRRFVDAAFQRQGRREAENDTLCTLRLARRLLPGLSSKGLAGVADFYGIDIVGRHRALGDARATAEILLRFLEKLELEHDVETRDELLSFQYCKYDRSRRTPEHIGRLRRQVAADLPEAPGVYFMKSEKGTILYIGKAKNLRRRVESYFAGVAAKPARTRKLVRNVRVIDHQEVPSELHALLLESRLIKQHKPTYNRAQRRYRSRSFIRLDTTEAFPRVSATAYVRDDGAEYYGPVGSRGAGERLVEVIDRYFKLRECSDDTFGEGRRCLYGQIDRCTAPCAEAEAASCYDVEVQRVRGLLTGQDDTILDVITDEMQAAADRLDFEEARRCRDLQKRLKRLIDHQRCVGTSVLDHHGVAFKRDPSGGMRLFIIQSGRLVDTVGAGVEMSRQELSAVLEEHFGPAPEPPERYFKEESDEVSLLRQWLYKHRDAVQQVPWQPGDAVEATAARILDEACAVQAQ